MKVKKGTQVYTGITQTDAANLAKELYSKNLNFQSDLINKLYMGYCNSFYTDI